MAAWMLANYTGTTVWVETVRGKIPPPVQNPVRRATIWSEPVEHLDRGATPF